jgi:acetyl-CoA carboxylase carboxyl transferase subunit beta
MNWIQNVARPRIKRLFSGKTARETPDNLWVKCPNCGEMIFHRDMAASLNVCPKCDHHIRIGAEERLRQVFGDQAIERIAVPDVPNDPLRFKDSKKYTDRLKEARSKTGQQDAFVIAAGTIENKALVVAVQNFEFLGGSLGMAAGEAFITAAETACLRKCPLVLFVASGGARMQEGILSLMQMPRTTVAVQMMRAQKIPYIVVFTDPTSGGVTASYAMLGDIHIAEPGAMIAFSGPRVIEQTIRERLPDGFQRAEYLQDHGMVDTVVHRHKLKEMLGTLITLFGGRTVTIDQYDATDSKAPRSVILPAIRTAKAEATP